MESLETVWAPAELAVLFRVCKALYGLVQSSRCWYMDVSGKMSKHGWKCLLPDRCIFILEDDEAHEVIAAASMMWTTPYYVVMKVTLSSSRRRRCFKRPTNGASGKRAKYLEALAISNKKTNQSDIDRGGGGGGQAPREDVLRPATAGRFSVLGCDNTCRNGRDHDCRHCRLPYRSVGRWKFAH